MREQKIIKEFKESLRSLLAISGLKIKLKSVRSKRHDIMAQMDYRGLRFDIIMVVAASNSLPAMINKINVLKSSVFDDSEVPVLVAPYLSPEKQKLCRASGIYYMDLSGNVYLIHRSFYFEKVGFPNKYPEKRQRRSPFSDKASLILRELLKESAKRQWGVRELAQKIGLNPGYVSRMAKALEELGYVSRHNQKLRIRSQKEILDDWVRAYDFKQNRLYGFFYLAAEVASIIEDLSNLQIPSQIKYALSVQAGAGLIAPHAVYKEVHIYVADEHGIEFLKDELQLKEADQGANMVLMRPYYKHSVFYNHQIIDGLPVVSDIQLYLDLYGYPVRGREQAGYLYDKRLKAIFDEP